MKITSKYLDREIEIPPTQFADGDETVTIIPHDVLEDLIYNSEEAAVNNIQVHYSIVVAEPRHYAFVCSINDKHGRRIESIGESLEDTLSTVISRNYPVLMAAKRAFDDAAIKFLGCPGKVYSDQQIEVENPGEENSAAPKKKAEEPAGRKSQRRTAAPKEAPAQTADEDISVDIADDVAADVADQPEPELPDEDISIAEEPESDDETADEGADEFDTTIIVCGSLKREGLSVRACYNKKPDAIEWIANTLPPKNDQYKQQKEICQRFLEHVKNGGK